MTEPFGYILKPFDDRDLKAAIEIAIYKHKVEQEVLVARRRLERAHRLAQLGDWERDMATGTFQVCAAACTST